MSLRAFAQRLLPRRVATAVAGGGARRSASGGSGGLASNKLAVGAGVVTAGCLAGQYFFGSEDNFYDHRFVTTADPNDLAEFYGNEDFMEIFCVFPFMVDFMMRSGYFDDNGHVHTFGLPPVVSNMVVSMQFDEREEEDADGETNTVCFNKKERFKCTDSLFGFTLWEMVQNFGYTQRDDGTSEVYHYGQSWRGPFFIRLVFQTHARYVIFATEQHLNSTRFLSRDEEEEDALVAQRHNIPFHLLGQFLDGLEVDVQAKLGAAATELAKLGPKDERKDAEFALLRAQVASLEATLKDLKAAPPRDDGARAPRHRRVEPPAQARRLGQGPLRPHAPAPRDARGRGGRGRGRKRRRDRGHRRRRQGARPRAPRHHRRRARARRGPLARGDRRKEAVRHPAPRHGHRGGGLRGVVARG